MNSEKSSFSVPASSRTLFNIGWRYLLRHPWQSVLMVIGITLGVAVVVAIDLANVSARRAFDLSTEAVAGRATHQIVGGPQGLDETVYTTLRRQGVTRLAAPIVSAYGTSPQLGQRPLQLLGVDPFAEAPFRSYVGSTGALPDAALIELLAQPNTVLISTDLAQRHGLAAGDAIDLDIAGHRRRVTIAGLLQPADDLSRRALNGLILADIATAQELTGQIGRLARIDLIVPEAEAQELTAKIEDLLPPEARIFPVDARTGTVAEMTAAFRTNLLALSLLALVVGLFLIYNTMTFAVVQRRPLFGTLRCLGVTRREIFALVVSEALLVGTLGSALGLGLGLIMGQGAVRMVTQTINDLYFTVTVSSFQVLPDSLIKGAILGIVATTVTTAVPAWEAASVPPQIALSRAGIETQARRAVVWFALAGLVLNAAGLGVLSWPTRNLTVGFVGTLAIVLGFAALTPLATIGLMQGASHLLGRTLGTLGRMAPRNVVNALSRTAVAVAALMVAVSVTIGVSLMINSFRATVVTWLEQILQGDIYISAPSVAASQYPTSIEPTVLTTVRAWPEIERIDVLRATLIDSPNGPVQLAAIINPTVGDRPYLTTDISATEIWPAMQNGAVVVSEPFANRLGLPQQGATVSLYTDHGAQDFPVVGIYYDYASSQGTVTMSLDTYRRWWQDGSFTGLGLHVNSGTDADAVARALEEALTPLQRLIVRPNRALRDEALAVFDRTFAITGALQLLATIVAFIGVLSALLALQLEKQREIGILRAIGLTVRQLWTLVLLETGLMGAVAGLLSAPTGYVLALILIYVINRRSFGWTLQLQIQATPFLVAMAVAVGAALLAGVYPARRLGRIQTVDALRYE